MLEPSRVRHRLDIILIVTACRSRSGHKDDALVHPADAVHLDAAKPDAGAATVKPPRSEHAVFKLVDNRHAAHRAIDGDYVIDAADIGFARFTRFGMPTPRWH